MRLLEKTFSNLLFVAFSLAGLWIIGFFVFLSAIPTHVVDKNTPTDAIVVLTGDNNRIDTGLSLLKRSLASKLLISGVSEKYAGPTIRRVKRTGLDTQDAVTLGYQADTTMGNALETAEWVSLQNFKSLRLVTSHYHMPRSLLEFKRHLPDTKIIPHPVAPKGARNWWQSPRGFRLVFLEYNKSIVVLTQLLLKV